MRKWYKFATASTLISMMLVVAACGSNNNSTNADEKSGDAGSEGSSNVTLTLWHNWAAQDAKSIAMRKILDDFQSSHPNIKIQAEGMPADALKTRLRTVAAADEMPDTFVMWPDVMTKEFVSGGLVQPVDDFLNSKPDWKNNFIEGALDGYTVDGKVYSAPLSLAVSSILYYNQNVFDQYSVKVPKTWSELIAAIDTFNKNGITPIAMGNKANWFAQSTIFSTVADRVTGSDWFLKAASQDGAQFTDPEFVEALKKMQELGTNNAFQKGFNSIDENQMAQLYFQGKTAMFISGGWATANVVQNAPKDILDATHVTIIPPIEGGAGLANSTSGVVGAGLGISSKLTGAKKDAALELMYALAGPEGQQATLGSSTLVSYNVPIDESTANPLFVELYHLTKDVKISPVYDAKLKSAAAEVTNNGLQELLSGGKAEDIAKKIQAAQAGALGK